MPLADYQRAKTGALFVGSTLAGAAAGGRGSRAVARARAKRSGEAYQVADDLRDVLCDADELGKPIGQDAVAFPAERRGAARDRRREGASRGPRQGRGRLHSAVPGAPSFAALIKAQTPQFFPKQLARVAA